MSASVGASSPLKRVSAAQHSPGPWLATDDDSLNGCDFIPVVDANGATIAEVQPDYTENRGRLSERDRANASLIAAAPNLLSIARRWAALDAGSWHPQRHASEKRELLVDTETAIAKATGA